MFRADMLLFLGTVHRQLLLCIKVDKKGNDQQPTDTIEYIPHPALNTKQEKDTIIKRAL